MTADTVPVEEMGIKLYITYMVSHPNHTIIRCCILTAVLSVPTVKNLLLLHNFYYYG